jgi:hypothetical protein
MFANAGRVASEAVDNIRTLTGLSAQYIFMDKYWRELDGPARKGLRKANISGISFGFTEFAMFGMVAGLDFVWLFPSTRSVQDGSNPILHAHMFETNGIQTGS